METVVELIKCRPEEKAKIKYLAKRAGVPIREFVLKRCLAVPVSLQDAIHVENELILIGLMLAECLETGRPVHEQLAHALVDAITDAIELLHDR